ncbi:Bactericidal permeability-increasing protein [Holothuria leucospilota]|uniref:Bactericidal permeability-increasing protein n=1 Tax=Holothuria leucospilota TaxID=206669 RepID=A0A9Q1CAH3_HOLLE|nr:Bactericidal permeability-increasing protein [Holothuria leucospilota]
MALISFGLVMLALTIMSSLSATASRPGVESRVTQRGIDFLRDVGMKKLKEKIYSMHIPSQSGKAHGVSYEVWNLKVTSFNITYPNIQLEAGSGFNIRLRGIRVTLTGDYHYSVFVISHSGRLDVNIDSMSASFTIKVREAYGRPTVESSLDSCMFDAGNVAVHLNEGKPSRDDKASRALRDALNGRACGEIVNGINEIMEEKLSQLKVRYPIRQILDLDYSIVALPFFSTNHMDISHKGEVYRIHSHEEAPLRIPEIQPDTDVSRMAFVWMTDFVANSAGYVLHTYGYLQHNVTEKDIPAGSKISLNTSGFPISTVFPQVTKMFPGKMMQINVKSTIPPTMNTTNEKATIAVKGKIDAYVTQPNKSLTYLFTLSSQISLSFKFGVKSGNVTWVSELVSSSVKLVKSAIKDFKIDILKKMLPIALKTQVIPMLNKKGAIGMAIPSYNGVTAVNTTVQHASGHLKIGTDFATL